ncbi:hypothetical protein ACN47E_001704 [Coniothyrium glycines]
MLISNDIAPKLRAPSIRSFDSGYVSNTLDDDDTFQTGRARGSSSVSRTQYPQASIGLGLSGLCNISVKGQLRLRQASPPVEPVTTKINVYTSRDGSNTDFLLPTSISNTETCSTCQVWNITWPEKGLKCDECRNEMSISPKALHIFDDQLEPNAPCPDIPKRSRLKRRSQFRISTRCSACEIALLIDPTKPKQCSSCSSDPELQSSSSPASPKRIPKVRRSCAKRPQKLPSHALQHLQEWLRDNKNNPYPDTETKRALAGICGITEKQVNTWFTNARARGVVKCIDHSNTGSEDEAGGAFRHPSVASTPYDVTQFVPTSSFAYPSSDTPKLTALETEQPSRRGKKKNYGHLNSASPVNYQASPAAPNVWSTSTPGNDKAQETWQCTFCYAPIAPKSWRRHEETQHRPKRKWTCLRDGPCVVISSRSSESKVCAFCMIKDPTEEHLLQSHRIGECLQKREEERTFLRPDHLRQHVKNFHKATLWDETRDLWRTDGRNEKEVENFTCGFCSTELKTWAVRETHIAGHFKDGLTMAAWKGCEEPIPTAEANRKRRNSSETQPGIFAKLARTLSGHGCRRQHAQHTTGEPSHSSAAIPNLLNTSMPPLLPDAIFDSYMAELYGNPIGHNDFAPPGGAEQHIPSVDERHDSAFPDDASIDLSFAGLFARAASEFRELWE